MKNLSIWISVGVVIVLLVLLKMNSGDTGDGSLAVAPTLVANKVESSLTSLSPEPNQLGDIIITGGKVDTEFPFKNDGTEPVSIVYGETSCMCTTAVVKRLNGEISSRIEMPGHGGTTRRMSMTIDPGEEATLVATFDPIAHGPNALGPINREVVIKTNSKTTPELRFTFFGNVIQ